MVQQNEDTQGGSENNSKHMLQKQDQTQEQQNRKPIIWCLNKLGACQNVGDSNVRSGE